MSINDSDISVSMLLSFIIASIRTLSYFFFLVTLSHFFTIPVVREKIKVKLVLAIPTGAPHYFLNLKKLKLGQYNQKQRHISLIFNYMFFFDQSLQ